MMAEKKGKKPKRLELWERTHTTKASRKAREESKGKKCPPLVYTTPGAMEIAVSIYFKFSLHFKH